MSGLLAVIAAPLLWPVAAILQLLFPVILRTQVRAYRWACVALVTESTLLTLHWLLGRYRPDWVAGWASPDRLLWTIVIVIAACTLAAWWQTPPPADRPHPVEWAAFGVLFLLFVGRVVLVPRLDLGAAVGIAAACALVHLAARRLSMAWLTTQRVFLTVLCLASAAAAADRPRPMPTSRIDVTGLWPTFRGNAQRTGSLDPADPGPTKPRILWRFRCPGDSRLYASPAIAGGELIVVANRTHATGNLMNTLFRLDAGTGRLAGGLNLGRAGVSSPAVRGPLVVVGEGYHEDNLCNLRIVDRSSGISVNSFPTTSHVESSPALDGSRVVFGAGDDGVFGAELTDDGAVRPLWHLEGDHVDASPLVAGGAVFVGSTGESDRPPLIFAVDAMSGTVRWKVSTPLPVIAAAAYDRGRVFVALSNGKLDRDADRPAGAVWCLDPTTGNRLWEVPATSGLYASPVCSAEHVFIAGGDGRCRCLRQSDGGQVWETSLGERIVASPIVSAGSMFVLLQSGVLVKLDSAIGQVLWRFDEIEEYATDHDAHASPVLANGRIYVAAGGHVFCIGGRRE